MEELATILETMGPWGVCAVLFWWVQRSTATNLELAQKSTAALIEMRAAIERLTDTLRDRDRKD